MPSCVLAIRSPTTKTSGRSGTDRSSSTQTRPARSTGTPSWLVSGLARTPAAHSTVRVVDALVADLHEVFSQVRNGRAGAHLDAEPLELLARVLRQALREGREQARPGLDQDHARLTRGSKWRKSLARVRPAISANAPASSTPGGSSADHHEGRPGAPGLRVLGHFGGFEGPQDAPRMSSASPIVLRPGACAAQASKPK